MPVADLVARTGGAVRFGRIDRGEAAVAVLSRTPTAPPYEPRVRLVAIVHSTPVTRRAANPARMPPRGP